VEGPLDLVGHADVDFQVVRHLKHQTRVLHETLAAHDTVEAAVQEFLRRFAVGDAANGRDEELVADCILDRLCERLRYCQ
jgi:hypothetical protein